MLDLAFRRAAAMASVLVVLLGTAVLLGWYLRVEILMSAVPGLVPMKPNTALCFILTGYSLHVRVRPERAAFSHAGQAGALLAAALGLVTLAEYTWQVNLGVDALLMPTEQAPRAASVRMAPNAAACLLLVGGSLVLLDSASSRCRALSRALALTSLAIAFVALSGYVYDLRAFHGLAGFESMALPTAAGLIVLATGVLAARPSEGLTAILIQEDPLGAGHRRFLPILLAAPMALGWIQLRGQRMGLYSAESGLALMATGCTLLLAASWFWNASVQRKGFLRDAVQRRHSVAEQARTEAAVRRSEARFRALVDASAQIVWGANAQGQLVEDSPSWRAFTGQTQAQWLEGALEAVHPDDQESVMQIWTHALTTRAPMEAAFRLRRHDGVWRWVALRSVPLLEVDGSVREWVGMNSDITDQRAAEEIRRQSERLRERSHFFELSLDLVCIANPEGYFIELNPAFEQVLGFSRKELTAQSFLQFVHPEDQFAATRELQRINQGASVLKFTVRCRCKSGEYRSLQWRAAPDESGLIYATARDITDELRNTASLASSLKEREVLLQEIHHRVKNNLQVIASLISMQAHQLTDRASRIALEECRTRVQTIALIHERLYQSPDFSNIPFSDYVCNLVTNIFHATGVSPFQVTLDIRVVPLSLSVDKAIPCGLILNELISNALKHAFPGERQGSLRVELRKGVDDFILLSVADDGIGIREDFAIEKSDSLGLQLVSMLVDQLNGSLTVRREAGTTFEVRFPADALH